jgi:hypothetical protein
MRGYITGIDTPTINLTPQRFAAARLRAISMPEIRALLDEAVAKHILFIFDSCFAGTLFTNRGKNNSPGPLTADIVARLLEKPARDFITAGVPTPRCHSSPMAGAHAGDGSRLDGSCLDLS